MDNATSSWPLVEIEHPLANDVAYGRGGLANNHKGNKRFRRIVTKFKEEYAKCSRHEKTAMAERLVRQWRAQTPPGRFIKQDKATSLWYDVGSKARAKASQLLREGPLKDQENEVVLSDHDEAPVDSNPPPPPPVNRPAGEVHLGTPPQTRPTRELKEDLRVSPVSVMDMPFFDVESVAAAEGQRQPKKVISAWLEGILPPRRQKSKRTSSYTTSETSDSSDDIKPPAKRPALSPLASFMGGLFQEKMPAGPITITVVDDNARASPVPHQDPVSITEEVVYTTTAETNMVAATSDAARAPTPCTTNCAPLRDRPIPPPRRIACRDSSVSRGGSVERMPKDIFVQQEESEHSMSWRSLGIEDLDDDPILREWAISCETSNHTTALNTRVSVDTFSVSSRSSALDNLVEDLSSLPAMFRERCDTGSGHSAIDFLEKAQPNPGANLEDKMESELMDDFFNY